jgi:hypothetical protein
MTEQKALKKAQAKANETGGLYFVYQTQDFKYKVSKIVEKLQPLKWQLHFIAEPTNTTYCLISTSEKNHLELASKQWEKADNTQIAEVTNVNCKQVLIFIDDKWERLKHLDK